MCIFIFTRILLFQFYKLRMEIVPSRVIKFLCTTRRFPLILIFTKYVLFQKYIFLIIISKKLGKYYL